MPFGLKNAGTTYQRLMDQIFKQLIGQNVEFCVDDMFVKSHSISQHMAVLEEGFREIRKYDIRINLEKCTFRVDGGKFLGFMIPSRGRKANPNKCTAILEMRSPTNI